MNLQQQVLNIFALFSQLQQRAEIQPLTNSVSRQAIESDNITQQGTEFIQYEATQVRQVVTRQIPSEFTRRQPYTVPGQLSVSPNRFEAIRPVTNEKQFLAADGCSSYDGNKSYKIYDWSTKEWTLYKDALFFDHSDGFSFVYNNKVMICGGTETDRVEYVDPTCFGSASTFPVKLPGTDCGKGVLFEDKILTFGQHVRATSLKAPFQTTTVLCYRDGKKLSSYGVAYVNENTVVIVGGYIEEIVVTCTNTQKRLTDEVRLYNPTTKTMRNLAPLPYKLRDMAVVVHKDNFIILGGSSGGGNSRNDVLMYNITTQECRKLPKMLETRYDIFLLY